LLYDKTLTAKIRSERKWEEQMIGRSIKPRHCVVKSALWSASVLMLATGLSAPVLAQALPKATPEAVGMSSERLNRLTETFQHDVDAGEIPGAVVVVARNGKIAYEKAFGYQNREEKVPMKPDAIFRIASMSKPITSVAVMMLVEEGKIDLAAPVSQYLPEFQRSAGWHGAGAGHTPDDCARPASPHFGLGVFVRCARSVDQASLSGRQAWRLQPVSCRHGN
jgi:beta-lactamase family protein